MKKQLAHNMKTRNWKKNLQSIKITLNFVTFSFSKLYGISKTRTGNKMEKFN